jgi:hypothetical protein
MGRMCRNILSYFKVLYQHLPDGSEEDVEGPQQSRAPPREFSTRTKLSTQIANGSDSSGMGTIRRDFLFATTSRLTLGPNQPPVQCVL